MEGSPAAVNASEQRPDWLPAELVSGGLGVRLAAPSNMLHCWVTENKPITWAEAVPAAEAPTSFCRAA